MPQKVKTPPQKEETTPPAVDVVPFSRERSNTTPMITIESAEGVTSEVKLRPPSDLTNKDLVHRKSGQW